jgi:hypothetical protein
MHYMGRMLKQVVHIVATALKRVKKKGKEIM